MQKSLLISFLVIASLQVYAQKNQWVKKYPLNTQAYYFGNGTAYVIEDYDKGFFIVNGGVNGQLYGVRILKTDVNGNILWQRLVGPGDKLQAGISGAVATPDGGLLIEGPTYKTDSTFDNYLLKINACGQVEWYKIYGLNQYSIGGRVTILGNGDIVVSSYVAISKDTTLGNYYNNWTFLTDPQGNIKWQVFDNLSLEGLLIDNKENILTTGSCYLPDLMYPGVGVIECGLVKLDTSGIRLWYAEYDVKKNIAADGASTVQTSDNGYLTLADQRNINAIMLIKFDAGGAAQWTKLIGDTEQYEYCRNMSSINNGAYLVAAATNVDQYDNFVSDLKLLEVNEQGQVLKQVIFPDTGQHDWIFYDVGVTSDHKYTLISTGNYSGGNDSVMVLKFNENLDLDTFYTHDTNKYDYLCNHKIRYDSVINFDTSHSIPITIPFPADTATIINPGRFAVYPNPSSGFVNVLCPLANTSAFATIYDMLGRVIGQYNFVPGNLGQAQINIGSVSAGCYVMVLEQKGKRYKQKLMVE